MAAQRPHGLGRNNNSQVSTKHHKKEASTYKKDKKDKLPANETLKQKSKTNHAAIKNTAHNPNCFKLQVIFCIILLLKTKMHRKAILPKPIDAIHVLTKKNLYNR